MKNNTNKSNEGLGAGAGASEVDLPLQLSNNISIRTGKYGDYIFYKTSKMKKPTFHKLTGYRGEYKDKQQLLKWISDTYDIC